MVIALARGTSVADSCHTRADNKDLSSAVVWNRECCFITAGKQPIDRRSSAASPSCASSKNTHTEALGWPLFAVELHLDVTVGKRDAAAVFLYFSGENRTQRAYLEVAVDIRGTHRNRQANGYRVI
jgi:hypothetical protein